MEDYVFKPEDYEESSDQNYGEDEVEHLHEGPSKDEIVKMLMAVIKMMPDQPNPDGEYAEGTICKFQLPGEDRKESVVCMVIRDWYAEVTQEQIDRANAEGNNEKQYEVAIFTQHKLFTTQMVRKDQLTPMFDHHEVGSVLAEEFHPHVYAIMASMLGGIIAEERCPGCKHKRERRKKS